MNSCIEKKKHSFPLILKSVLLVSQLNFVTSSRLVTENESCPGKTGTNGNCSYTLKYPEIVLCRNANLQQNTQEEQKNKICFAVEHTVQNISWYSEICNIIIKLELIFHSLLIQKSLLQEGTKRGKDNNSVKEKLGMVWLITSMELSHSCEAAGKKNSCLVYVIRRYSVDKNPSTDSYTEPAESSSGWIDPVVKSRGREHNSAFYWSDRPDFRIRIRQRYSLLLYNHL